MNPATSTLAGLYVGPIAILGPEGQRSGIVKRSVSRVQVTAEGIVGDEQADRRVHGGPEKAVHHYAAENYARLAARFPEAAAALVPGGIGENLSTGGWTEDTVHIGDVFQVRGVRLQVSQPRSPCWKIDHRFGVDGMARFVADERIAGWYYRVLSPGPMAVGDAFLHVDRPAHTVSLRRFAAVATSAHAMPGELAELARIDALAATWKAKLADRLAWLARH
jgi:MOSC domain-containing protein YiiM